MNRLIAAGLLLAGLGFATMAAPGLVPVPLDRAFVYLVGVGALLLAYRAVLVRRERGVRRAATGDPEVPTAMPLPGEDLHDAIADLIGSRTFYRRRGLQEAAIRVLARYSGLSETAARERVDRGSWTEDPYAATHLGEHAPPVPLADRLGALLRLRSSYGLGRRRAIEAVARTAGITPGTASRGLSLPAVADRVESAPLGDEPGRLETGHWRGVSAVALAAIGVGVLADVAPVVLSGVLGIGFAAYARAASAPSIDLHVEREVETDRPDAGERMAVTLTVRNDGDDPLPDLRVVDGVPGPLSVVEGSPRLGTALRPGEGAELRYVLEAGRGVHAFEPVTVLARDLAGTVEAGRRLPVGTTLTCVPTPAPLSTSVPLRTAATQYAGRVQTPSGGEGVEFYATRAYRPGDPTSRIDWNRRARTGELATLEFREERAATVVVVVDAREACYVAQAAHEPHAVDRSVDAAGRIVETLLSTGDRVGVAALGADTWLAPGTGRDHRVRVRELLATDPALSSTPPTDPPEGGWRRRLDRRLPSDAQLLVLTPLADALSARLVRTLDASGTPATVVSPDPTVAVPEGPLLARVARRVRVTDLRGAGIPVIDWTPEESLDAALARGDRRRPW